MSLHCINANLKSIDDALLSIKESNGDSALTLADLTSLVLHGNSITRLYSSQLTPCSNLRVLRLSSNNIAFADIFGLSSFPNIEDLDIAANAVSRVRGFGSLANLTKLNLAFNCLRSLEWLSESLTNLPREFHGDAAAQSHQLSKLRVLDIRDNDITDLDQLRYLACVPSLRELRLQNVVLTEVNPKSLSSLHFRAANPVCKLPIYFESVLLHCPDLEVLDGLATAVWKDLYNQADTHSTDEHRIPTSNKALERPDMPSSLINQAVFSEHEDHHAPILTSSTASEGTNASEKSSIVPSAPVSPLSESLSSIHELSLLLPKQLFNGSDVGASTRSAEFLLMETLDTSATSSFTESESETDHSSPIYANRTHDLDETVVTNASTPRLIRLKGSASSNNTNYNNENESFTPLPSTSSAEASTDRLTPARKRIIRGPAATTLTHPEDMYENAIHTLFRTEHVRTDDLSTQGVPSLVQSEVKELNSSPVADLLVLNSPKLNHIMEKVVDRTLATYSEEEVVKANAELDMLLSAAAGEQSVQSPDRTHRNAKMTSGFPHTKLHLGKEANQAGFEAHESSLSNSIDVDAINYPDSASTQSNSILVGEKLQENVAVEEASEHPELADINNFFKTFSAIYAHPSNRVLDDAIVQVVSTASRTSPYESPLDNTNTDATSSAKLESHLELGPAETMDASVDMSSPQKDNVLTESFYQSVNTIYSSIVNTVEENRHFAILLNEDATTLVADEVYPNSLSVAGPQKLAEPTGLEVGPDLQSSPLESGIYETTPEQPVLVTTQMKTDTNESQVVDTTHITTMSDVSSDDGSGTALLSTDNVRNISRNVEEVNQQPIVNESAPFGTDIANYSYAASVAAEKNILSSDSHDFSLTSVEASVCCGGIASQAPLTKTASGSVSPSRSPMQTEERKGNGQECGIHVPPPMPQAAAPIVPSRSASVQDESDFPKSKTIQGEETRDQPFESASLISQPAEEPISLTQEHGNDRFVNPGHDSANQMNETSTQFIDDRISRTLPDHEISQSLPLNSIEGQRIASNEGDNKEGSNSECPAERKMYTVLMEILPIELRRTMSRIHSSPVFQKFFTDLGSLDSEFDYQVDTDTLVKFFSKMNLAIDSVDKTTRSNKREILALKSTVEDTKLSYEEQLNRVHVELFEVLEKLQHSERFQNKVIANIHNEVEREIQACVSRSNERILCARAVIEEQSIKIVELENQISALLDEKRHHQHLLESFQSRAADQAKEIQRLQSEEAEKVLQYHTELRRYQISHESEHVKLFEKQKSLQQLLGECEVQKTNLEHELRMQKTVLDDNIVTISSLRTELNRLQKKYDSLDKENRDSTLDLRSQLSNASEEMLVLQQEYSDYKAKCESTLLEAVKAIEEKQSLESALENQKLEFHALQKECDRLKDALAKSSAIAQEKVKALTYISSEVSLLKSKYEEKLDILNKKYEVVVAEKNSLEGRLRTIQNKYEEELVNHKQTQNMLEVENQRRIESDKRVDTVEMEMTALLLELEKFRQWKLESAKKLTEALSNMPP